MSCKVSAPDVVQEKFSHDFPAAENVKWGKETKDEYEAEFYINKVEMSANYNASGEWLETETVTPYESLPAEVKAGFEKEYAADKAVEASLITNSRGETLYEIEVKKGFGTHDMLFDSHGTMVQEGE